MGNNLADIVLSGMSGRNQAMATWAASKRARRASQDQSLTDFGHSILQMPSLIKQKETEDDIKSMDEAFSGAILAGGDLDTALGSLRMMKPRTREGAQRLGELALQAEQIKTHRRAMAQDAVKRAAEERIIAARKKIGAGKDVLGMMQLPQAPLAAAGGIPMVQNQPYTAAEATGLAFQQGVSPKDVGLDPIFRAEQAQMTERGRNARAADANAIREANLKSIDDYRRRMGDLKALGLSEDDAHKTAMEEIRRGEETGRNTRADAANKIRESGIRIRSEDVAKQIASREGIARAREKFQRDLADETRSNKTDAEKISAAKGLLADASSQIKAVRAEIAKAKRLDPEADTSAQEKELAAFEATHEQAQAVLEQAANQTAQKPSGQGGEAPAEGATRMDANGQTWTRRGGKWVLGK